MKLVLLPTLAVAAVSCDPERQPDRTLSAQPTMAELAGLYQLTAGETAAAPLVEMGYTDIDGSVELRPDGTFLGTKIPGCCLHGYDERVFPFTGGLYTVSGDWTIHEADSSFTIGWEIDEVSELTHLVIDDSELAKKRTPPTSVQVSVIRAEPLELGFKLFDGAQWPVVFSRTRMGQQGPDIENFD